MALNTVNESTGLPVPVAGEVFLVTRTGISFNADVQEVGRFHGYGKVILSTLRIVFIRRKSTTRGDDDNFRSMEIPLAFFKGEAFNQPIFGANNLTGTVDRFHVGPSSVTITFKSGGVGTFLKLLAKVLTAHRKEVMQQTSSFVRQAQAGAMTQSAFIDPSDPSTVFLSQPPAAVVVVPVDSSGDSEAAVATAVPVYGSYLRRRRRPRAE